VAKRKDPNVDQAKRFIAIRDKLQASTGLAADNPRLGFLATCELRMEQLSARVVAGDDGVSLADLQAMRQLIDESTPITQTEVKLTIIGGKPMKERVSCACGVDHHIEPVCTVCGFRQNGDTAAEHRHRWYMVKASPETRGKAIAPVEEPPAIEAAEPDAVPSEPTAPMQPPRRNPGSVHDASGARMTPASSYQVRAYVGGVSAPFGRGVLSEPAPNWSAAHPLPPIPRE
jgi:hypothetical protein